MIKPYNRALGAKGKQANRDFARGNTPLLPTAPPPVGEVLAALPPCANLSCSSYSGKKSAPSGVAKELDL
jgi:hypothetical protein